MSDINIENIRLSFIIVNYNTSALVRDCIESIIQTVSSVSFEIIVVDNASNENVAEALSDYIDKIILIENKTNFGFGKANNIGAANARGEFLLFINSDTIVYKDVFKTITTFMSENNSYGTLGIWLTDKDGNVVHSYGIFSKYIRSALKESYKEEETGTYKEVEVVVGADLLMTKVLFDKFGGFDENIFLYEEEMELQLRLRLNGYKAVIYKTDGIYHLEGKSSTSYFKQVCIFNSSCYIVKKYLNRAYYVKYRIKKTIRSIGALLRDLITFKSRTIINEKCTFFLHTLVYKVPKVS